MFSQKQSNGLSLIDKQSLEIFADGIAENNLNYWKSLKLKSSSVLSILAEVEFSNNALDSNTIKVYGWKIVRQHPVKISTLEEALDDYREAYEIVTFLKQLPFGCVAVIMLLQTPKGLGIFTYGFPVQ